MFFEAENQHPVGLQQTGEFLATKVRSEVVQCMIINDRNMEGV